MGVKLKKIKKKKGKKKKIKEGRKENGNKESNNKINNFIPYHFMERLVDKEQTKENIKEIKKHDDKIFHDSLKLFGCLPLYYNLCSQYYNNLQTFNNKTKKKIEDKILTFNKKEKFDLKYFESIRKMIDNEITIHELNFYNEYISFKYFILK